MELGDSFVPTAGVVGVLPMLTYFFLWVATYAFLGNFIFALASRTSVAPEHRSSRIFTAIIAAVAGLSYFMIQGYYHDMLHALAQLPDPNDRQQLINESYNAIGQYRYMDWAITTPLLLLKCVTMLKIDFKEARGSIIALLAADFFMVLTGYIGEQQLDADGTILAGAKLVWGGISTVGYLIIPIILFGLWKRFRERAYPEEQQAYRLMALTTVTFWGIYPVGYILTILNIDLNYVHIAFTIADIINKVGIGVLAYQASRQVLGRRVSADATMPGRELS